MPSFKEEVEEKLEPIWGATLAAISCLYGFWPVMSLYETLIVKGGGGVGWFVLIIFGLISWGVVMAVTVYPLASLMIAIENVAARLLICISAIAFFILMRGKPPLAAMIVIGLAFAAGFFQSMRSRQDGKDRREFLDE
jgi:hypothetical protein